MPRLELVETSLRYGQQALMLSRLRQRHAVRAAELLDACGFSALEVFGGATFEAQLRFLGEDPFERLRALAAAAPRTPLMATLHGQMLVAHRHLPDDVVEAFVRLAAQAGVGVFRLLDPPTAVPHLPVTVSFCAQTGQALLAYQAAHRAGATRADVSVSPLGGGAAFPPAEAVIAGFAGTEDATGIEMEPVIRVAHFLDEIAPLYADSVDPALFRYDGSALRGLLPASAMGHGVAELRERGALDRLPDVEAEISRVRRELGNPPLVTPFPEVITTQAVYNVFEGDRYATISQEIKDYCLGFFGTPPEPIDPDVRELVNGREEPITCRPADLLEPGLPAARRDLGREDFGDDPEALVTYALFGSDFLAFARGESAVERLADESLETPTRGVDTEGSPPAHEDVGEVGTAGGDPGGEVRELRVEVDGQTYDVRVFGAGPAAARSVSPPAASGPPPTGAGTITAPMQGLILKVAVKPGDRVQIGDVVAVLEAMKMQNDIVAHRTGTVAVVHVREGDVVGPKAPIADIE